MNDSEPTRQEIIEGIALGVERHLRNIEFGRGPHGSKPSDVLAQVLEDFLNKHKTEIIKTITK